jgi:hypothetical protein
MPEAQEAAVDAVDEVAAVAEQHAVAGQDYSGQSNILKKGLCSGLGTKSLTMDTNQLQIRCVHHRRNSYNTLVQTMAKTSRMSWPTR